MKRSFLLSMLNNKSKDKQEAHKPRKHTKIACIHHFKSLIFFYGTVEFNRLHICSKALWAALRQAVGNTPIPSWIKKRYRNSSQMLKDLFGQAAGRQWLATNQIPQWICQKFWNWYGFPGHSQSFYMRTAQNQRKLAPPWRWRLASIPMDFSQSWGLLSICSPWLGQQYLPFIKRHAISQWHVKVGSLSHSVPSKGKAAVSCGIDLISGSSLSKNTEIYYSH